MTSQDGEHADIASVELSSMHVLSGVRRVALRTGSWTNLFADYHANREWTIVSLKNYQHEMEASVYRLAKKQRCGLIEHETISSP